MSQAVAAARLVHRSNLLSSAYRLSNRQQLNAIFKRSAQSKAVSKPAPYLTREVIKDKFMNAAPGWVMVTIIFVACKFYLGWNGIDYNAIRNYKAPYVTREGDVFDY